jgi:hypothetical protein
MPTSDASRDVELERLAAEFVERHRRGEHPALHEYTARHPELARDIRELFPALVQIERLKPAGGDCTGEAGAPAADVPPRERLGEYRLLREVGRGGMGVVYEAEQESLGRHVALKVLPTQTLLNPIYLERFRREARAAAKLHHTNIVPVFGSGEADGVPYYAMQFIRGEGLDKVLADLRNLRRGPVPVSTSAAGVAHSMIAGRFAVPPTVDEAAGTAVAPHRRRRPALRRRCRAIPRRRNITAVSPRSVRRSPRRWRMLTNRGCCTATSSRRTCSWMRRGASGSPTSAWPRRKGPTS